MTRLLAALFAAASLATLGACSSGVSDSAGGGAGTTTGGTDLIANATLAPDSFSSDAFATDADGDPATTNDIQTISTDFATLTINVTDPLGRFSRIFQQVNFNSFEIRYIEGNGGAPNLGLRKVSDSLSITLSDGQGSGSVSIPLVDNVTKRQFRDQASGSTIFNYTVEVRAIGSDIVTSSQIIVVARVTIEIGEFV